MKRALGHPRSRDVQWLKAYHELWLGNYASSGQQFAAIPKNSANIAMLPLIDSLVRQGLTAEAIAKIKVREDLVPENANPVEAWEMVFINLMLGDLDKMKAYAIAYQKLRPEKAQGLLMEWLVLEMQDQPTQKVKNETLAFMKSSSRYDVAGRLLADGKLPDEESLTNIPDENVRLDTALLFVLLDLEAGRNPRPSLKTAQISFRPGTFPYTTFNYLAYHFLRAGSPSREKD